MWGLRLQSSKAPAAWRTITYEKGSWVLHMLRRRTGDAKFLALLGEICKQYRNATMSTDQFRETAVAFAPKEWRDAKLEAFFDRWVYSTGVPDLKLNWSVKGKAPALRLTGTVTQTAVDDDFSTEVPVSIQLPGGKSRIQWVHTSSQPVTFTVALTAAPLKVTLDPSGAVLRR
jgi:aminopeptidase N